jgi:protein TonB
MGIAFIWITQYSVIMTYMNPNEGTTITIPELTNTVIQLTELFRMSCNHKNRTQDKTKNVDTQ